MATSLQVEPDTPAKGSGAGAGAAGVVSAAGGAGIFPAWLVGAGSGGAAGGGGGGAAPTGSSSSSSSGVSVPLLLVLALVVSAVFPWSCVFGGEGGGASPMRVAWPKPRPGPDPRSGAGLAHGANASAQAGFKTWVEEGMALAALDFDPQVTPAYIAEGPPLPCRNGADKVRLFLLGDSLNRIMIDDACGALGGSAQSWSQGFAYRVDASPDKLCVTADGVIAFLNIYGSAPRGPYYGNHSSALNPRDDPWADTELRVQHGLDQFTEKFGAPTFVIFRSELWDLHVTAYKPIETIDKTALFAKFLDDSRTVFRYIRARFPRAYLGMHTTPTIRWGMTLFHQYQNAVRRLARESDELFLFDFQLTLQDLPLDVYLRDTHHPKPVYLASFLDLIYRSALRWVQSCEPE